ncbi:hypothetical protein GCM10027418_16420 [Mariniluteicoccus endophyticus]
MARRRRGCLAVGLAVALLGGGALSAGLYASRQGWIEPLPIEERCVISGSTGTVVLTPEQARLTSIIVGRSVARGLSPRAATIAMATAYQESGIRNLDHGDRDSLGLFQQRPSQGWGTPAQIRDPWYASDAFYAALVKVPAWETGDINDTAQKVQRSGHPQAYRKHEEKARILAEVFTGHRAAGVTCALKARSKPLCIDCHVDIDPFALQREAWLTFGMAGEIQAESGVRWTPRSEEEAWRLAAFSVVNGPRVAVTHVRVGQRRWENSRLRPATWGGGSPDGVVVATGLP